MIKIANTLGQKSDFACTCFNIFVDPCAKGNKTRLVCSHLHFLRVIEHRHAKRACFFFLSKTSELDSIAISSIQQVQLRLIYSKKKKQTKTFISSYEVQYQAKIYQGLILTILSVALFIRTSWFFPARQLSYKQSCNNS